MLRLLGDESESVFSRFGIFHCIIERLLNSFTCSCIGGEFIYKYVSVPAKH